MTDTENPPIPNLTLRIGGATLQNPVGVASGTFGYGSEYERLFDLDTLGAVYTKAVTVAPREGNPPPRIIETPSGILNSIGLANVGLEVFLQEKLPVLEKFKAAVVVNVAGSTPEEYADVIAGLDRESTVWGYEINLSCPNVKHGCLAFGTDPGGVREITTGLRSCTKKPLIVKLTPNVTDIAAIAAAAEAGGADGISCINTLVGMVIDTERKRPVLPAGTGGLSGPSIRPVGVAAVYRVARAVSIPVIGIGGIMDTDDAIQYLLAGASAIQVGTGTFVDPGIPSGIAAGIPKYMQQHGIARIRDFHAFIP